MQTFDLTHVIDPFGNILGFRLIHKVDPEKCVKKAFCHGKSPFVGILCILKTDILRFDHPCSSQWLRSRSG